MILMYVAIITKNYPFLLVTTGLNGFFNLGIFSLAYELGVELTFPVGEAMSGGFINTIANSIGFIMVLSVTPILNAHREVDVLICFIIFGVLLVIALFLILASDIKLRRSGAEQHASDKEIQH